MRRFNSLIVGVMVGTLTLPPMPAIAKTRKGDKLANEARVAEAAGDYDKALELDSQAVELDPSDPSYLLALRRVRFEVGNMHVKNGRRLRDAGALENALAEFEKAWAADPSSDIAQQEIRRTRAMIERSKNAPDQPAEEKSLSPSALSRLRAQERTDMLLPLPELRPLNTDLIDLKMTNRPRVLFETVAKVAGINLLFDSEYNQQQTLQNVQVDLTRTTLDQALDQIALVTRSFWKPLSANTIFVTVDNPTKRREYAEQVVKVFYLTNITGPQEMQEMLTVLRTVVDVQKVFNYTAQNALVVRAEADTMALVEKLISDLDKPRSEVIVDVMVMGVSSTHIRNLTAAFAATGINTALVPPSTTPTTTSTTSTSSTTTPTTSTTTTPSAVTTIQSLGRINQYTLTNVPGATLEAILNDSSTRVLQAPQIRAVSNAKASIKIGDKVPTATGSFQPGVGGVGVGVNALVNTQFTFIDVGVNVEITPWIHDNNEISLHLDLDVSQVKDRINIGGIEQPEIQQNKSTADIRLREGEVNLIGGIIQQTSSRAITGIPGLGQLPIIGKLFSGENTEHDKSELVIALVPHIVRGPDVTESNLKGVAAGNATQIKVNYAPRPAPPALIGNAPPATAPPAQTAPTAGTPAPAAPPATAAPATAPPATAPPITAPPVAPPVPGLTGVPIPTPAPGPAPAAATPGSGGSRASFVPARLEAQLSSSATVTVQLDNATDLASVAAHLQFDPRILRVVNIVVGDLPQRNAAPLQPVRNILNDVGQADVLITRGPADGGVSGSGSVFSIIFQAVGRGDTQVTLPFLRATSTSGQPISSAVPGPLPVSVR
jgi:general secretion pathway protein D